MSFSNEALSDDLLLGGRVRMRQPRRGFRASTDAVLLAAAVAAKPGDRVLDVGCGAGAATLCLMARLPGLVAVGLELQGDYADLARANGAPEVFEGDLFDPPAALRGDGFDWAMTNPPYFEPADIASPEPGRDRARRAERDASDWVRATLKRVRSGGRIVIIQKAQRLPDVLAGLAGGAGDIAVLPLQARHGRAAGRVIVSARKGARGPFRLAPPFVLHEGPRHEADRDDFTIEADRVLRDAEALVF